MGECMLKNIVLIRDPECNIYLIDQEILIDTGTGQHFEQIKEFIETNFDISKIKTIINTHCHYDHTGGNKKFHPSRVEMPSTTTPAKRYIFMELS